MSCWIGRAYTDAIASQAKSCAAALPPFSPSEQLHVDLLPCTTGRQYHNCCVSYSGLLAICAS